MLRIFVAARFCHLISTRICLLPAISLFTTGPLGRRCWSATPVAQFQGVARCVILEIGRLGFWVWNPFPWIFLTFYVDSCHNISYIFPTYFLSANMIFMIKGKNAVFHISRSWCRICWIALWRIEFQKKTPSWLSSQSLPATSFLVKGECRRCWLFLFGGMHFNRPNLTAFTLKKWSPIWTLGPIPKAFCVRGPHQLS